MNNFLLILPDLEVPTDLANIGSILDFKSCGSSLLDLLLMTESLGKGVKMSKVMSLNPLEWESAKFFCDNPGKYIHRGHVVTLILLSSAFKVQKQPETIYK